MLFLGIVSFIFCSFSAFCADKTPAIEAEVKADKDKFTIGDKIKYTVLIKTPKNIEVESVTFKEKEGAQPQEENFSIRDFGIERKSSFLNKKLELEYWYILTTYNTGQLTIPPAIIKYKDKKDTSWLVQETNEVTVEVVSLLNQGEETQDIKDIKEPAPPKSNFMRILLIILLIVFFPAAGFILYKKYFSKKETLKPVFIEPAHVIALRKLEALKEKNLPQHGKIEAYYVELSAIVRYYIENRFNIRAPEMTTEEFLHTLKDKNVLNPAQKSLLREFLTAADIVKFAKFRPDNTAINDSFAMAYRFVEETKNSNA